MKKEEFKELMDLLKKAELMVLLLYLEPLVTGNIKIKALSQRIIW